MHATIWKILLSALIALPLLCQARPAFVAVFIDARTEARLGSFPYDRGVYADALNALQKLAAKGVVLKFFLDQPKGKGDDALALSMTKLPGILQARCDDSEANSNPLDARFSTLAGKDSNFAVTCKSGWIPLAQLQANAANVCFIDQPVTKVAPLLERYQGRAVKTLYGCALELARKPVPTTDGSGTRAIDLSKAPRVDAISLVNVLDGKIDRARIAGKIVVFGYEGVKAAMFVTPLGRISAHRVVMENLLALEQMDVAK